MKDDVSKDLASSKDVAKLASLRSLQAQNPEQEETKEAWLPKESADTDGQEAMEEESVTTDESSGYVFGGGRRAHCIPKDTQVAGRTMKVTAM